MKKPKEDGTLVKIGELSNLKILSDNGWEEFVRYDDFETGERWMLRFTYSSNQDLLNVDFRRIDSNDKIVERYSGTDQRKAFNLRQRLNNITDGVY